MLDSHYAPRSRVVLVESLSEAAVASSAHPGAVVLDLVRRLGRRTPATLYAELRRADDLGVATIIAVMPPPVGLGHAIRDRLTRPPHRAPPTDVVRVTAARQTRRMRILVTGGHGFLGRHLLRQVGDSHELVTPSTPSSTSATPTQISSAMGDIRPDAVVHLAYRQPDWITNADGSTNVARACADAGARLVHLSTDVVFGDREVPVDGGRCHVSDARVRTLEGGRRRKRWPTCPAR